MNHLLDLARHKPDVVVLGVAHSGTSILTKALFALGWSRLDAEPVLGESQLVARINQQLLAGQPADEPALLRLLAGQSPWVAKDPHFVFTLVDWVPLFARLRLQPLLVCITRDRAGVLGSWQRRGEAQPDPESHIIYAEQRARQQFTDWPWTKLCVDHASLCAAAAMFDPPTEPGHG